MRLLAASILLWCATAFAQMPPGVVDDLLWQVTKPASVAGAGWSPTNAFGWWHADSMTANDGDLVSRWPDSASTHDLYVYGANSVTYSPYFTNNIINSKPAVYFNGNNKALTNSLGATLSQPVTWFMVLKFDVLAAQSILIDGVNATDRLILQSQGFFSPSFALYAGTTRDIYYNTNSAPSWMVWTFYLSGADSFIRTNGVLIGKAADTIGTKSTAGMTLGNRYTAATYPLRGAVAELVMYNAALATNDMIWVETNLRSKYGL